MKKVLLFIIFFILSFFVVLSVNAEEIKNFQSTIKINKDGTINVQEDISYDFGGLNKHGIYRDIPNIKINQDGKRFQLDFSNFSVTDENGQPYNFTSSNIGDNIQLKIGDADRTITGLHTYIISYEVSGALTYFSDHDELYWNVTGNGWNGLILSAHSKVELPQSVNESRIKTICYTGPVGVKETQCVSNYKEGKADFSTNNPLLINSGLTIVFSFPKNIAAVLEPKPYVPFSETLLGKLVMGLIGLIGLIWYFLLPLYIIYRWIKYGRDPKATVGVTSAWFDPPKIFDGKRFLTPGEVGTLGDETVDLKDISSTIVDLARRGYFIIDERKKGDFYLIKKKDPDNKLLKFEQKLITGFFDGEKEIRIKDEDLYVTAEEAKKLLYVQVVDDKLFDKNPQTTRTIYYVIAIVGLFTGNIALAIIAFLFGRVMPRKTLEGSNAANVAKSLKNFLESQERQLEFQADKQMMFEKLLPYAIAFGVEKIWAKRFQNLGIQQPNWYRSYSTANFNSWIFINSLNYSMQTFQTAATPTRSTSGFSSGFGGGGFSGGGGGGGGGGSW